MGFWYYSRNKADAAISTASYFCQPELMFRSWSIPPAWGSRSFPNWNFLYVCVPMAYFQLHYSY